MKYVFMALGLSAIVFLVVVLEPPKSKTSPAAHSAVRHGVVTIGTTTVPVEVADTPQKRAQGLSGRSSLPEGSGMLFPLSREWAWGVWMKDMRFSVDIIWADTDGRIVTIAKHISPESYPTSFYPSAPARYILEVPAGFADLNGISEGMTIDFSAL